MLRDELIMSSRLNETHLEVPHFSMSKSPYSSSSSPSAKNSLASGDICERVASPCVSEFSQIRSRLSSPVMRVAMVRKICFGRLPEEYHIGSQFVIPLSPLCARLTPCDVCGRVTTDSVKCSKAHVTCRDCSLRQPAGVNPDAELKVKCHACGTIVPAVRITISKPLLQILEFGCGPCGFEGTLDRIKSHRESSENQCRSVEQPRARMKATDIRKMHSLRDKVRELQKTFSYYEEYVKELEKKVGDLRRKSSSHGTYHPKVLTTIGSRGMISIECKKNCTTGRYEVMSRDDVSNIGCLPLRVKSSEKVLRNDERWLSISIAPQILPANVHRKFNISLKVHDCYGGIVTEKHIKTYDDAKKKFIHPCFESTNGSLYEFANILATSDLTEKQMLIYENLYISISLWPDSTEAVEPKQPTPKQPKA